MKRKLAMLLCLVLLCLCAACGGRGGWVYDLPNDYRLHCVDGEVCVEQNGEQALGYGVSAFCEGARFVGIRQTLGTETEAETYWFLIDTEKGMSYAAETEEDFQELCGGFSADDLNDWIDVSQRPDGAHRG